MKLQKSLHIRDESLGFSISKYIAVILFALLVAIPLAYIIMSGFKTSSEISRPLSLPGSFYLGNYVKVLGNKMVMLSFLNSIVITGCAVLICIIFCSLAAYPLARNKNKAFMAIYFIFLSAMMIPAVANLTSIYSLMNTLGLRNTLIGLSLLESALQIPLGVMLYTGFIKTIPRELDEAAMIDGCGYFRRFFSVIFPLLKPVTFSYAALMSIYVWNDFLMPMLVVSQNSKKPITLAVYNFVGENMVDYGAIFAALIIAIIPPLIFFLIFQRHLYSGITAGAVKG